MSILPTDPHLRLCRRLSRERRHRTVESQGLGHQELLKSSKRDSRVRVRVAVMVKGKPMTKRNWEVGKVSWRVTASTLRPRKGKT